MRISRLLLHNITSQGNDNASQIESEWKIAVTQASNGFIQSE